MNALFNKLEAAVASTVVVYRKVAFPIQPYANDAIRFSANKDDVSGYMGRVTPDGFNYIIQRVSSFLNSEQAQDFRKRARELFYEQGNLDKFVELVNDYRALQEQTIPAEKNRELIAALVDDVDLAGLLTTYNPYSHADVLDLVRSAGFEDSLTAYSVTPREMKLYFKTRQDGPFEYGLLLRNGMTGHVALSYNMYVRSEKYEYFTAIAGKRKHMSKLDSAVGRIEEAFSEARTIDINNYMENTVDSGLVRNTVLKYNSSSDKYGILKNDILNLADQPLINIVRRLHQYTGYKGYKTLASNILNILFKEITQHVGQD